MDSKTSSGVKLVKPLLFILYYPAVVCKHHIDQGGGGYSLNNYVLLKSKQCSHNLQSNQQICLLIILWITKDWWFWDKNWKREVEGGTISLYCSLVIHKCIDIMPLFRQHITAQGHIIGNIDKVNNSLLHNCDTGTLKSFQL